MELDQRRLIVVKNLLNKLEFYTDEVVEDGNRKGSAPGLVSTTKQ